MERWYKVSLVALTAVWLVLPPAGRADPAGGGRAEAGGPRQLIQRGSVVRAEIPFGARAATAPAGDGIGIPVAAPPAAIVEQAPEPDLTVAGGPEFEPEFDLEPETEPRHEPVPETAAEPAEAPTREPEVPVQAAVVPPVPEPQRAYLPPPEPEDEGPVDESPSVETAILSPSAVDVPASVRPPSAPPAAGTFRTSWPRPPAPPIAGPMPSPGPVEAVYLPRPPTPPAARRPQADVAAPQTASLGVGSGPESEAERELPRVVSPPVTTLTPRREMAQRKAVAAEPAAPSGDADAVFVVAPPDRLSPTRFPNYTACVSGENVILGRTVFGNSMIVPESNRAAAIKVGLCDVIMVTRAGDAEYARRQLAFVGLPADIHRK